MKQATITLALLGAIVLAGCGNGDTTTQSTFNNGSGDQPFKPITHLAHRSIVTNNFSGHLQVFDTFKDQLSTFTFVVGAQPTYIQPSPDGTLSFVNNTGSNSISSLNNNLEAVKATINLGGFTDSFVTSVSNKVGFAAVYNFSNGTVNTPGAILPFNPTDGSLNTAIPFPNVRYLAMDTAEKHLLAFKDVTDPNGNDNAYWVDLTSFDANGLPSVSLPLRDTAGNVIPLSRPVAAFFSADNTKAFILSCGVECGGSSNPSVTELDVTSPPTAATGWTATVVKQWPVSGARRGLIDVVANKLYVAGSTTLIDAGGVSVQDGFFTTIDIAAQTASAPIRIGNGAKRWIRNINGTFWVASLNCGAQSCVTMVNPATGAATVLSAAHGDATGVSLAVNTGRVYTIEGGEVFIYDQKGKPFISEFTTDVKGQASDVLYID